MNCPCGSGKQFSRCCEPFLKGLDLPKTAEELMRSRYSAFTVADIDYLKNTMATESRKMFNVSDTEKWAKKSKWKGLTIVSTKNGGAQDGIGTVEFKAVYEQSGQDIEHHEVSEFKKDKDGHWKFVDGESHTHKPGESHDHHDGEIKQRPVLREAPKVGRNDPCPCGSGKKYKKCCSA